MFIECSLQEGTENILITLVEFLEQGFARWKLWEAPYTTLASGNVGEQSWCEHRFQITHNLVQIRAVNTRFPH